MKANKIQLARIRGKKIKKAVDLVLMDNYINPKLGIYPRIKASTSIIYQPTTGDNFNGDGKLKWDSIDPNKL